MSLSLSLRSAHWVMKAKGALHLLKSMRNRPNPCLWCWGMIIMQETLYFCWQSFSCGREGGTDRGCQTPLKWAIPCTCRWLCTTVRGGEPECQVRLKQSNPTANQSNHQLTTNHRLRACVSIMSLFLEASSITYE